MKRTVLAIMIPTLLVAGAANAAVIYDKDNNKLDLYGSITGDYHFGNKNSGYERGDASYVRLGLKGSTQINNNLQGFGRIEYNLAPNAENNFNGPDQIRFAYAGLQDDRYGKVSYGRQSGVMYDVTGFTDVLPEWGEDTQGYTLASSNVPVYSASMFGTSRSDSILQYRNSWNGFDLGLQYLGANDSYSGSNGYGVTAENGSGYGVSLRYEMDMGLTLGASYNNARKSDNQKAYGFNDQNAQMWSVGAKYDANNIYAAINYSQTKNQLPFVVGAHSSKAANSIDSAATGQAIFAVAQYSFENGLNPSIAYAQGWLREPNGYQGNQNYSKYIDLALTYNFNANMYAYVDYKINLLDSNEYTANNNVYTNNVAAVGLQYNF